MSNSLNNNLVTLTEACRQLRETLQKQQDAVRLIEEALADMARSQAQSQSQAQGQNHGIQVSQPDDLLFRRFYH